MKEREFFVGYLPAPHGVSRFYKFLVPVLLLLGLSVSYVVSSSQKPVGNGTWDLTRESNVTGYLSLDPYPILHRADGDSVMLVRPGKIGADPLVEPYVGQHVAIRGVPIERGGWLMLELYAEEDLQLSDPDTAFDPPDTMASDRVTLSGEIVDSKCFLGVMKPGAGKVHRACAAMCLTGGMPPMLVVEDADGDKFGYMLITADGGSASLISVPNVALPVEVTGRLELRGDLTYLRLEDNGIRRIPSV